MFSTRMNSNIILCSAVIVFELSGHFDAEFPNLNQNLKHKRTIQLTTLKFFEQ